MSVGRKEITTSPEIRDALSGLNEIGPASRRVSAVPANESFPASGAVPVGGDDIVKLPFSLGDVINGKYEVIGLIGAGGVGFVVSAMHLELGEMVALKFLREEAMVHEQVVARFAREARAAAKIKSEYVARVYDVGSLPTGVPFIVMEYLHGKDLADVVRQHGRLPIKTAAEYMMQACEALASAHSVGIVHRDIKPENLFLARQAEGIELIKVLDFGISKVALQSGRNTGERKFVKTMMPMGTPSYMSPEQIRSAGEVDARTDIWALGCVLFELLTGTCVFDAPTLMQLGAAILERQPIPLRKLAPEAPAELEAVINRCLEKDASKRYQNVAELAIALYPFAPRRARLQAERTSNLLNSLNPGSVPTEFASVAPPASEPVIPDEAVVEIGAPVVPLPLVTKSNPVANSNPSHDEVRALRARPTRYVALAALALVAGIGFAIYHSTRDGAEAAAPSTPPSAPALTAASNANAAPAAVAKAVATQAAAAAPTASQSAVANANEPRAARAQAPSTPRATVKYRGMAKPRAGVAGRSTTRDDEEMDVGY